MQRWRSDPLPLAIETARVTRVDLEFEGVRSDAGSFTAFVFLNDDAVPEDAGRDYPSFAAAFSVFAHGRCWGDEGHCDWRRDRVSAFDVRPPHHLAPINVTLDVSETALQLPSLDPLVVTVHAARVDDPAATEGVFRFSTLTALAYQ
jgi:hypothetical protein